VEALGAPYGHAGERRRNPGGLSDYEQDLVDWYRASDVSARMMIRQLTERFYLSSERD
jgi:hypothetical protein